MALVTLRSVSTVLETSGMVYDLDGDITARTIVTLQRLCIPPSPFSRRVVSLLDWRKSCLAPSSRLRCWSHFSCKYAFYGRVSFKQGEQVSITKEEVMQVNRQFITEQAVDKGVGETLWREG
jgi:hypothetical protein